MRTSNPAMNPQVFERESFGATSEAMTIQGAVNKCTLLIILTMISALANWHLLRTGNPASMPLMQIGAIGGFIVALVTIFKKDLSPLTAPVYAILEGLALGGVSAIYASLYEGIVFQAVFLTFGTLACLLIAYSSGIIKVTEKLKLGIVAATGAIALVYLFAFIASFFMQVRLFGIFENGLVGIGFSLVVVAVAAFNLLLDFDFIEKGASVGAPKYFEWYGAFGLLVTLVWLYLEILKLLSKLNRRR